MSTEENKALICRLFEESLNQNKPSGFDQLLYPSVPDKG